MTEKFPDHSILAEAETRLEQRDSSYRWIGEAGGKLSDFRGWPFALSGRETLAANALIHAQMARIAAAIESARVD